MNPWLGLGSLFLALGLVLSSVSAGGNDDKKSKAKADFEAFFKKLDSNGDGKLTRDEFVRMAERSKDLDKAREKLSKAYEKLDPDKKGLPKEIFRRYLQENSNAKKRDEK